MNYFRVVFQFFRKHRQKTRKKTPNTFLWYIWQ